MSDIHLSLKPPVFRSNEEDWLATQAGYLKELTKVAGISGGMGSSLPILCGGDVFDKWNSPAELINFAIRYLPHLYAVPGQHDLPHHNYKDIRKSAYWTLVEAGKIQTLEIQEGHPQTIEGTDQLAIWGYPWGDLVRPCPTPHSLYLDVCISHSYIWTEKTGYPGAPPEQRLKVYKRKLRGYDVALFGDNHCPVSFNLDKSADTVTVFNPGGFMRRTVDQLAHRPRVGILYNDGSVEPYYLDISRDVVNEKQIQSIGKSGRMDALIDVLKNISTGSTDFEAEVKKALNRMNPNEEVRRLVLACLEVGK